MFFFEPIDGHANRIIPTFIIEHNGSVEQKFTRRIKVTKAVAIEIHFGYEPLWLYLEPGQKMLVYLNLDLFTGKSTNGGLKIYGPNAKGNEYFNEFNFQPGAKFQLIDDILSNHSYSDASSIVKHFIFKIDSSFWYLKKLVRLKLVSPQFYELVTNDLSLSYVSEFGQSISQLKVSRKNKIVVIDSLYKVYSPNNTKNLQGLFNGVYYYRYGIYKDTHTYNSGLLREDSILQIGKAGYQIVKNFIPYIYLKGEILKFEWGMGIYEYKRFFPDRYKETDILPYLKKFPNSWLVQVADMNLKNNKGKASVSSSSEVDSSKIVLLTADSISCFQDIFSTFFKNKTVYVDFWATWCLPCKQEFSFNSSLDSFFQKKGIERLYISFDNPGNWDAVLKNIYSFKLYGKHLLLTKAIFDDIIGTIYNGKSTYSIPRYLIINRMNQIVEKNAKRPSSGKELLDQLALYMQEGM